MAWPVTIAATFCYVVMQTLQPSKARVALASAMVVPALFMQFTWGQAILANFNSPADQPSTTKIANQPTHNQPAVQGASTNTPSADKVKVLQAVNGDTLDVDRNGQPYRVKLLGLSAPAMTASSTGKAECFGPEAQMFLDSLLRGRTIELQADDLVTDTNSTTILNRYVVMEDGTKVNQLMLEAGLARPDIKTDYQSIAEYKAYAEAAKAAKKGLWLNCDKPTTTPTPTPKITPTPSVTPTITVTTTPTTVKPNNPGH